MVRAACMFHSQGISYFMGMVFHLMSLGVFCALFETSLEILLRFSVLRSFFFHLCFLGERGRGAKAHFDFLTQIVALDMIDLPQGFSHEWRICISDGVLICRANRCSHVICTQVAWYLRWRSPLFLLYYMYHLFFPPCEFVLDFYSRNQKLKNQSHNSNMHKRNNLFKANPFKC